MRELKMFREQAERSFGQLSSDVERRMAANVLMGRPSILGRIGFMLVIATFTTCAVMLLEAFAFDLYLRIALFVQIIVSNCMILGRIEVFASRQPFGQALLDALGTAMGFALALLALGSIREALGHGTLLAGMDLLFGAWASNWQIDLLPEGKRLIVARSSRGSRR